VLDPVANYRAAAQALCDKINDGITPRLRDTGAWKITTGAELPNEARDFVFVIDWVVGD
jgi:molybdopterin biosynthesis enzyme